MVKLVSRISGIESFRNNLVLGGSSGITLVFLSFFKLIFFLNFIL
jgi:hypothetical protein